MKNVPLLRKLRDTIAADPEHHDQNWFRMSGLRDCGATYCAAGFVVELTGGVWTERLDVIPPDMPMRVPEHPAHYAQRMLGLSATEADRLFYGTDDAEVVPYLDELINRGEHEELHGL